MSFSQYRGAAVGTVLLGASAGYAAGVVGPPVRALIAEFDVSLTAIGLLALAAFSGLAGIVNLPRAPAR